MRNDATLRILENMLGLLLAGGLDPQVAAWTADVLAMLVTYAAIEAEARVPHDERLAELDLGQLQQLVGLVEHDFRHVRAGLDVSTPFELEHVPLGTDHDAVGEPLGERACGRTGHWDTSWVTAASAKRLGAKRAMS